MYNIYIELIVLKGWPMGWLYKGGHRREEKNFDGTPGTPPHSIHQVFSLIYIVRYYWNYYWPKLYLG